MTGDGCASWSMFAQLKGSQLCMRLSMDLSAGDTCSTNWLRLPVLLTRIPRSVFSDIPMCPWRLSGIVLYEAARTPKFKLERGKQYFVSGGSVGQPRDNTPKAADIGYA